MAISKIQSRLEQLWYAKTAWWMWFFLPLHWLLKLLVWLRRAFYRWGLFKSNKLSVPVIVIGNINVGGTGKTPLAIYLIKLLQSLGFKPGLVTRGYGGKTELHPLLVSASSKVTEVGDEPLLIFNRTQVPIVADYQRSRGGLKLIEEHQCDIIVCDDGLQHYKLQRDLELLVIDKTRGFGNGWLMPLGPLRETPTRAKEVDLKVVNGESMLLKPLAIRALADGRDCTKEQLGASHAVAAIGNPQRFFATLESLNIEFSGHAFADHYAFKVEDFENFDSNIIMTEKDAVKCRDFCDKRFYYLPVAAELAPALEKQLKSLVLALKTA